MLAISLVFVGITLFINGLLLYKSQDRYFLIIINFFTGFIVVFFNLYLIIAGDPTKIVGYFGGLLFGLTNILIAFDNIFKNQNSGTGWYSFLATICAVSIATFYLVTNQLLKGIFWGLWSLIWLFAFLGFVVNKKFDKATYIMFIVQGVTTTGLYGLLQLFSIIKL